MENSFIFLKLIFSISIVLTILFMALAIFIFFRLKIGDVIPELRGKTRRNSIRRMEKKYLDSGALQGTEAPQSGGEFFITREEMIIHTQERI